MTLWLAPTAVWAIGALLIGRRAIVALAEAQLLVRSIDALDREGRLSDLPGLTGRLAVVLAATRFETARPLSLLREAAREGRRPAPATEP